MMCADKSAIHVASFMSVLRRGTFLMCAVDRGNRARLVHSPTGLTTPIARGSPAAWRLEKLQHASRKVRRSLDGWPMTAPIEHNEIRRRQIIQQSDCPFERHHTVETSVDDQR